MPNKHIEVSDEEIAEKVANIIEAFVAVPYTPQHLPRFFRQLKQLAVDFGIQPRIFVSVSCILYEHKKTNISFRMNHEGAFHHGMLRDGWSFWEIYTIVNAALKYKEPPPAFWV